MSYLLGCQNLTQDSGDSWHYLLQHLIISYAYDHLLSHTAREQSEVCHQQGEIIRKSIV